MKTTSSAIPCCCSVTLATSRWPRARAETDIARRDQGRVASPLSFFFTSPYWDPTPIQRRRVFRAWGDRPRESVRYGRFSPASFLRLLSIATKIVPAGPVRGILQGGHQVFSTILMYTEKRGRGTILVAIESMNKRMQNSHPIDEPVSPTR